LLTHEEGKNSEEGSGPGNVSVKEGQGLDQIEGSIAKPYLKQNQPNVPETGSRTVPELLLNLVHQETLLEKKVY